MRLLIILAIIITFPDFSKGQSGWDRYGDFTVAEILNSYPSPDPSVLSDSVDVHFELIAIEVVFKAQVTYLDSIREISQLQRECYKHVF